MSEENDQSKTKQFLEAVIQQDPSGAKQLAHSMMQDKVRDALSHEKIRVATTLFGK